MLSSFKGTAMVGTLELKSMGALAAGRETLRELPSTLRLVGLLQRRGHQNYQYWSPIFLWYHLPPVCLKMMLVTILTDICPSFQRFGLVFGRGSLPWALVGLAASVGLCNFVQGVQFVHRDFGLRGVKKGPWLWDSRFNALVLNVVSGG